MQESGQLEGDFRAGNAAALFDRLDILSAAEQRLTAQREDLDKQLAAVHAARQELTGWIKSLGIRRTGLADTAGPETQEADAQPAEVSERFTIKEMIVEVVGKASPPGLRPVEIGRIIKDRYGHDVTTSLHTQIARLEKEGAITKDGKVWKLAQKNAG